MSFGDKLYGKKEIFSFRVLYFDTIQYKRMYFLKKRKKRKKNTFPKISLLSPSVSSNFREIRKYYTARPDRLTLIKYTQHIHIIYHPPVYHHSNLYCMSFDFNSMERNSDLDNSVRRRTSPATESPANDADIDRNLSGPPANSKKGKDKGVLKFALRASSPAHRNIKESPLSSDAIFKQVYSINL